MYFLLLVGVGGCILVSSLRPTNPLVQGFPTFPLQCTPSEFQQISMYPFSILTDEHVPLKFPMTKHFIIIIDTCLTMSI